MTPPPLPLPGPAALAHSRQLTGLIAEQLRSRGGWMNFETYMDLALYAPGLGYYAAGAAKLGAAGDFVTAPELSPLFGQTLARQVGEVLAHTGGDVLELGAGSGGLAADLLESLRHDGVLPARYLILEPSADLAQRQRRALAALPPALYSRLHWIERLPTVFTGVVVANEVLDAVPVQLLRWGAEGELFQRGVALGPEGLRWDDRPLLPGALEREARRLAPAPPYVSELGLRGRALVASLAGILERGVLLFLDYGFGEREYYHPQRAEGTLMCHYRHFAHADPFYLPGLQDITAHVDFTAMARCAIAAGLELLGYTTQAHFLINLGITELLARTPADQLLDYAPRSQAVQKLLSPAEMGELFKVLMVGRGLVGAPRGFATGDRCRSL